LKHYARSQGFAHVGCCAATVPPHLDQFRTWLETGYAGEMRYLVDRAECYADPQTVLRGARSIVMLGMQYRTAEPAAVAAGQGRVARYAWGTHDYHDVIHERLHALADWTRTRLPGVGVRGVVDTAPLLEREFAQLAGLGWIGKNTLLLTRGGSWFFLAALLLDVELEYDAPFPTDHCGTCTACLDACPTAAFPAPYVLDATRCISYLTIELRGEIPRELRAGVGEWLFGCDICQEVCPWNRKAPVSEQREFMPRDDQNPVDLIGLFELDDEGFRRRFRRTPLWRARRRGLLRTAAIVLGNQRYAPAIDVLTRGLDDAEELVRSACAWALAEIRRESDA
jgi:epoxyqueuosine reductase